MVSLPSRRSFLAGAGASAFAQSRRRPNLLVILADDMGFSDPGCYGGEIDTPNLDSLARNGLRFTQAYSCARCVPSRGSLLTGYYSPQTGIEQTSRVKPAAWARFIPQYLSPLGYRCYHAGKWHIPASMPLRDTGFHHSYFLGDQDRFFSPTRHHLDDQPLAPVKPGEGYYATSAIAGHAINWLNRHQREHAADPFFLYLAFTSPHFPLHALQPDIRRFEKRYKAGWDVVRRERSIRQRRLGLPPVTPAPLEPETRPYWNTPDSELTARIGSKEVSRALPWDSLSKEQKEFQSAKMAIHAAMVYRMDAEIGRLIGQLKKMDAFRDTAILFLSDNGASSEQLIRADGHDPEAAPGSARSHLCLGPGWATAANSPFRRHKSWVHEGGISSPLIAHWPTGIAERGALRRTPCHLIDVLPTLVDLAGGPAPAPGEGGPPRPGRSLAPAFSQDREIAREYLFFHHMENRALRMGDWKIVASGKSAPWELYDLAADRGETTDLASRQPDRVRAMAARWESLEREFLAQKS
ncbi:MAG: sulfatase-like hydrolase/transferase [Bryobacteraceae bacterium]|nr:sulfatase-like hydrolase/transferase [Bryobacteraceae bacterium]